jgi:imidazolonepropionase-like amidohydrolase
MDLRSMRGLLRASSRRIYYGKAGGLALSAPQDGVLLRGGHVLTADGVQQVDISIQGDRIATVGPSPAEEYERVIDLAGAYVLPGLIDAHTHLTHGYEGSVDDREAAQGVRASFQALRALRSGITTLRELGSYRQVDIALRDSIKAGRTLGPRMLCAGTYLSITGGHGHPKGRASDGPVEARKGVREQLLAGADLIKVMCSGGAAREDESANASQFTFEEIQAIVDEAALADRKVAAHAHPTRSIKWALEAGAYSIEHGTYLDDECSDLMMENDAFLVPTLNVYRTIAESERWPELRRRATELYEDKVKTFRRAADRGIRWAVGSDCSMFLPVENFHDELAETCAALDIESSEVLRAATAGNAELLGLRDLGDIREGYLADLIVVDEGNPISDLSTLQNIRYTIIDGHVIDWAAEEAARGPGWWRRIGGKS